MQPLNHQRCSGPLLNCWIYFFPWYPSCKTHACYSHYYAPLGPFYHSGESVVQLPSCLASKQAASSSPKASLVFSCSPYISQTLLLCLHLSLVLICAVFSSDMPVSGTFRNTFGWGQERWGANACVQGGSYIFLGLIQMNEGKRRKENN